MAFSANRKLIRLSLARNAITHFGPRFGNMSSLAFVDLSENNIAFLQHEQTDDFDTVSELSNLTIDLYKNPLSCGCDSLAFWYWVVGQTGVRLHRLEEYKCTLSNGSEISYSVLERELDSVWLQCQGQRLLNIAIGMLACLLLPLFVLGEWIVFGVVGVVVVVWWWRCVVVVAGGVRFLLLTSLVLWMCCCYCCCRCC